MVAELIFWVSAAGLFYIYLGYPALIALFARLRPRPVRKGPFDGRVSVVIAAHNEAKTLPAKIAGLRKVRGADRIIEVLVGSDGSTDNTTEAVRNLDDAGVRVLEFAERRGKAAVLNDVIPQCRGDIVVLTDARQELDPGALENLLDAFADRAVGVVSGELVFRRGEDDTTTAQGIGAYWNYEKFIRKQESRFGSVPGATGALYAIRRELFKQIPPVTLLDDVVIPMQVVLQRYRCVFEEAARVFDTPSQSPEQEAVRKRRTIAGNGQLIGLYPGWLLPWRNPIWFQYVSHKMGRLLSPFFLAGALAASLMLFRDPLYASILAGQALLYGMAIVGRITPIRWCGAATFFVSLNLTILYALADTVTGRFNVKWGKGTHGGEC